MSLPAEHPQRPMNAEQAIEWLGLTGVLSPERLIEMAQRRQISHIKLPATGAYLWKVEHLVEYINQPAFEHLIGVHQTLGAGEVQACKREQSCEVEKLPRPGRSRKADRPAAAKTYRPRARAR